MRKHIKAAHEGGIASRGHRTRRPTFLSTAMSLKMVVGLGNPGPNYAKNRHNIGFQCVELFASRHGFTLDKFQLKALTGQGWVTCAGARQKVLAVKPLTYMNLSGEAVGALAHFYQIEAADILVIHDDLDLAIGRLRLRPGGSSGGQNGVKSMIQKLGSQEFHRTRVGIGRPAGAMDAAAYVLQNFTPAEEEIMAPLRQRVCDAVVCWLCEGMTTAMNRFNAEPAGAEPAANNKPAASKLSGDRVEP